MYQICGHFCALLTGAFLQLSPAPCEQLLTEHDPFLENHNTIPKHRVLGFGFDILSLESSCFLSCI